MGSPQDAALRHRLSNIRAIVQTFETDLTTASPLAKPDIELMISFYKDAERNAKNEIELHELTHGGIDTKRRACAHPERYISNAPAPPIDIYDRTPRRPHPTREELIERKRAALESELQRVEARSSELQKAIEDWYLLALPEWNRVTANARTRRTNSQQLAAEQDGALKVRHEQMLGSKGRAALPDDLPTSFPLAAPLQETPEPIPPAPLLIGNNRSGPTPEERSSDTRSVFERYAIVSRGDIVDAMRKLQINQQESQIGHEIGHAAQTDQIDATPKSVN